jgi:hypothetical protein
VEDLSRFEFGITAQYEKFRGAQLRDWMLYQVEKQGIDSRSELIDLARQAIDFNNIAAARAIGLSQQPTRDNERIERSFSELIENGWMTGEGRLAVTNSGKQRLNQWA